MTVLLSSRFRPRRLAPWLAILACGLLLSISTSSSVAQEDRPEVFRVRLKSAIHPVAAEFLAEAIEEADRYGADAFVLELDTPGGLMTSMREIVTAILGADVPVVVYVSPRGAQAASAGFFILLAADVAAMAPGTNTGAASPVMGQGEDVGETMKAKVEEDAAAMIRSLAQRTGRNVEAAEKAVVEARSYSAEEALELGLVDLIADDLDDLLEAMDGREVTLEGDEVVALASAGAHVRDVEMTLFQRILAVIADPTIAYLLLSLGGLGLMVELYNPGSILPGVVGAICLILAFFGLSVLPVNYAGIALILLALVFFIAEVKVTSYGLLTVAGVTCLVLGGLMLIKTPEPAMQVSVQAIVGLSLFALLVVGLLMSLVVRTHRGQVTTGLDGLLHEQGQARTELAPRGKVFVHGEIWDAEAEIPVSAGQRVEVTGVERMTLRVRPLGGPGAGSN